VGAWARRARQLLSREECPVAFSGGGFQRRAGGGERKWKKRFGRARLLSSAEFFFFGGSQKPAPAVRPRMAPAGWGEDSRAAGPLLLIGRPLIHEADGVNNVVARVGVHSHVLPEKKAPCRPKRIDPGVQSSRSTARDFSSSPGRAGGQGAEIACRFGQNTQVLRRPDKRTARVSIAAGKLGGKTWRSASENSRIRTDRHVSAVDQGGGPPRGTEERLKAAPPPPGLPRAAYAWDAFRGLPMDGH